MRSIYVIMILTGFLAIFSITGCGDDAATTDATSDTSGSEFTVSGTLSNFTAVSLVRQAKGELLATETTITADKVMAVNSASSNSERVFSDINDDGSFEIDLEPGVPWVVVFIDSTQTGPEMITGMYKTEELDLDSLAPTEEGSAALGDITVEDDADGEGIGTSTLSLSDLIAALNLSYEGASLLGFLDDLCLRYKNPDIDGNGVIDETENKSFGLDFHIRYDMTDGTNKVDFVDLIDEYTDSSTTQVEYTLGSAIATWAGDGIEFGSTTSADYRVNFPDFSGSYYVSGGSGSGAQSYTAGAWIENDSHMYTSAGDSSVGISFDNTMELPQGEYDFEVAGTQLTFTNVETHTLAEMNNATSMIMPFLKFTPETEGCTGWSCVISSVDYKWMKMTDEGWVDATLEELTLVIGSDGAYVSFQIAGDTSKSASFSLAMSAVSGSVSTSDITISQGSATAAELASLTVGQLCHVGISYDDKLGMRIFQAWGEGPDCD